MCQASPAYLHPCICLSPDTRSYDGGERPAITLQYYPTVVSPPGYYWLARTQITSRVSRRDRSRGHRQPVSSGVRMKRTGVIPMHFLSEPHCLNQT